MRAVFAAALMVSMLLPSDIRAGGALAFPKGCVSGQRIVIAAVGDLLFHRSLQTEALKPEGSYSEFWGPVKSVIEDADLAYGNLEGTAAEGVADGGREMRDPGRKLDGRVYDSVLQTLNFNYHPSVIADIKAAGFDVVSTANNHAGDRGAIGIDRTALACEREGLLCAGTRPRSRNSGPWSVITEAKGVRVAWIACTYGVNAIDDAPHQVLHCYRDKAVIFDELARDRADPAIDAVILTPHWGIENSPNPLRYDRQYARDAVAAGATAIIGAHPHVLQPWEAIPTADGRDALVIYSTGNFISNQRQLPQRSGVIALIELTKPVAGKAEISAAGFIPTWVDIGGVHRVVEMQDGVREYMYPLRETLKLLPKGLRVTAAHFRDLSRECADSPVLPVIAEPLPSPEAPPLATPAAQPAVAEAASNDVPPPAQAAKPGGASAAAEAAPARTLPEGNGEASGELAGIR